MILKDLIKKLEECNPNTVIKLGFDNPHSYRGDYNQLSFEPKENCRVGDMLNDAKLALNSSFDGWKGGTYFMDDYTIVNLSKRGECGWNLSDDTITLRLLNYMLKDVV